MSIGYHLMSAIPPYAGKCTVYLDHNVLDLFLKGGLEELRQGFIERCQLVYSDETLREIQRSKGYEKEFLTLLNALGAMHLKLVMEEPDFKATGQATLTARDAFAAYEEFCQPQTSLVALVKAMQQFAFKLMGGRLDDSITDILAEQKAAFAGFMEDFVNLGKDLPEEAQLLMTTLAEQMNAAFQASTQKLEDTIHEQVPDTVGWNAMKQFREELKVGPKRLNNIQGPDVVKKIWTRCEEFFLAQGTAIDLEDFFQLKQDTNQPLSPHYDYQRVDFIYNKLNMLGYYPDSNMHKDRRFIAAMSDQSHASLASFCDVLLSMDENFILKVEAAYEYLKIPTKTWYLKPKSAGDTE